MTMQFRTSMRNNAEGGGLVGGPPVRDKIPHIIRVFPIKTRATPDDEMAAIDRQPGLFDKADEVHISVLFTWDIPKAERLAESWQRIAPVKIGGPGAGSRGEDFIPGKYVKSGYVITSRGCPNRCWFCSVWKREGNEVRELPICEGHNVLDDNLLACSEGHIRRVFEMLRRQKKPIEFSGGWEAARLKPWHIDILMTVQLGQVWFAYDDDKDFEPLIAAGKMLSDAGLNRTASGAVSHRVRCYVLIGWPGDTMEKAEARLRRAYQYGFLPMAMLYKNETGSASKEWRRFQRPWARPASINRICRDNIPLDKRGRCVYIESVRANHDIANK